MRKLIIFSVVIGVILAYFVLGAPGTDYFVKNKKGTAIPAGLDLAGLTIQKIKDLTAGQNFNIINKLANKTPNPEPNLEKPSEQTQINPLNPQETIKDLGVKLKDFTQETFQDLKQAGLSKVNSWVCPISQ